MPEPLTGSDLAKAPRGPTPAALAERGRVRPILLHPDPMLRQACAPVGQLPWDRLCQLAGDLLATMYHAQGRGLAAPQIGEPFRIFVMDATWKQGKPQPLVVLDPQVIALGVDEDTALETCLSLPDQPVSVRRPVQIRLDHFALMGEAMVLHLSGTEARIAQHEADHLDGRLILDLADASKADL